MTTTTVSSFPIRIAAIEVAGIEVTNDETGLIRCQLLIRAGQQNPVSMMGHGHSPAVAVAAAVSQLCTQPLTIVHHEKRLSEHSGVDSNEHEVVSVRSVVGVCSSAQLSTADTADSVVDLPLDPIQSLQANAGVGRAMSQQADISLAIACLRAASHAGLLKREYRANNQKLLRDWSRELVAELSLLDTEPTPPAIKTLEAESVVLESLNRVASAAVITAVNHPKPDSILRLFDTSAWLFDSSGQPRDSYTDTNLWLAWYPGVRNGDKTVDEVIGTMPAAPEVAIPWIVKLFENPTSRLRFRGAVDLEDHDVLHVLLGRGLQDQDEAFVLGFAMGTAKRVSRIETTLFRWILAHLYPEPYCIPSFLHPAFDLGVQCGRQTGAANLYKQQLKNLRSLTLDEARQRAEIDMNVVREFYALEQQQIPFTIASLRLP